VVVVVVVWGGGGEGSNKLNKSAQGVKSEMRKCRLKGYINLQWDLKQKGVKQGLGVHHYSETTI
jgi:hypothetical protein